MIRLGLFLRRFSGDDLSRPLVAAVDSFAPAHFTLLGLPVYVARLPPAPFTEPPWRLRSIHLPDKRKLEANVH